MLAFKHDRAWASDARANSASNDDAFSMVQHNGAGEPPWFGKRELRARRLPTAPVDEHLRSVGRVEVSVHASRRDDGVSAIFLRHGCRSDEGPREDERAAPCPRECGGTPQCLRNVVRIRDNGGYVEGDSSCGLPKNLRITGAWSRSL